MDFYKLCVYIPESHLEIVKSALFAAGAGKYHGYDCCCWQVKGVGQFRPLSGSDPFLGTKSEVEVVDEFRLEMIVDKLLTGDVIEALKKAHPYEVPAYDFTEILMM